MSVATNSLYQWRFCGTGPSHARANIQIRLRACAWWQVYSCSSLCKYTYAYECAWVCACVYACAVCVRVHMLLLLLVRFQLGPRLTSHVAFPCGTNVELVRVESRQRVRCVFRCCAILPDLLLRAIVLQLASVQIHCILQYEERLHRPGWVCSELLLHLELQPPRPSVLRFRSALRPSTASPHSTAVPLRRCRCRR